MARNQDAPDLPAPTKRAKDSLVERPYVEAVEGVRSYDVAIALGSRRAWRNRKGGTFEKRATNATTGQTQVVHIPAIHVFERVSLKTLNGAISEHNAFVVANEQRSGALGDIGHMFAVIDYTPREESPTDVREDASRRPTAEQVAELTEAIVARMLPAVLQAVVQTQPQATAAGSRNRERQ